MALLEDVRTVLMEEDPPGPKKRRQAERESEPTRGSSSASASGPPATDAEGSPAPGDMIIEEGPSGEEPPDYGGEEPQDDEGDEVEGPAGGPPGEDFDEPPSGEAEEAERTTEGSEQPEPEPMVHRAGTGDTCGGCGEDIGEAWARNCRWCGSRCHVACLVTCSNDECGWRFCKGCEPLHTHTRNKMRGPVGWMPPEEWARQKAEHERTL